MLGAWAFFPRTSRFDRYARMHNAKYQTMIRRLVDFYNERELAEQVQEVRRVRSCGSKPTDR